MAPKGGPGGRESAASRQAKAKAKTEDKSAASRQAKARLEEKQRLDEEKRLVQQQALEEESALKLQRAIRGWKVRNALKQLFVLEDHILVRPTTAKDAVEKLQPPERNRSNEDSKKSGQSVTAGALLQLQMGLQLSQRLQKLKSVNRRASNLPTLKEGEVQAFAMEDGQFLDTQEKMRRLSKNSCLDGMATPPAGKPGTRTPRAGSKDAPQSDNTAPNSARSRNGAAAEQGAPADSRQGKRQASKVSKNSKTSKGSRPGSQAGSKPASASGSRRSSKTIDSQFTSASHISLGESDLAQRLFQVDGMQRADAAAKNIFWLLSADTLQAGHLSRIYRHHRLRRRNVHSRVKLRLALVCHGESYSPASPPCSPPTSPLSCRSDSSSEEVVRELTPEGWAQVTRTAWALRPCSEFSPTLVLTGSEPCCVQTAERLRALTDDTGVDTSAQFSVKPHPESVLCYELDGVHCPSPTAGSRDDAMVRTVYNTMEAVATALAGVEEAEAAEEVEGALPPIPTILLVASGSVLEVLLACLNAGHPEELRPTAMSYGRLMGGDAILLESPTLFRIVGETEDDEYEKSTTEVWAEGLKRNQWQVRQHIAGDGRQAWSSPTASRKVSCESAVELPVTSMREEWRSYCSEPLIMSQIELDRLIKRAGSIVLPLERREIAALRPLVNNYR